MSYYAARGGYSTRADRRRRRRKQYKLTLSLLALALIVFAALIIRFRINRANVERTLNEYADTFLPGVAINGVQLKGYDRESARQVLSAQYADGLNRSILLTFGDRSWSLVPSQVGAKVDMDRELEQAWAYGKEGSEEERLEQIQAMSEQGIELSAELTFDQEALRAFVADIKQEIDCEPVAATRTLVDTEKFLFTDSSVGYRLDAAQVESQLSGIILYGGDSHVELQPEVLTPSPTRAELEAATVLLAECTTSLEGSSTARNSNVNLALGYFNCMVVKPDAKVSFNKVVGQRTKENGFQSAPEYAGTTVVTGIGGGVCQASTTLYGALIRAGLKVTERHAHTMTVGYVPGSQDAAVNDKDKDLRFRNNTESELFFFAWTDPTKKQATVRVYGKPVDTSVRIEIVSEVLQADIRGGAITYQDDEDGTRIYYQDEAPLLIAQGKPGMRSRAYRVYYDLTSGQQVKQERLSEDYYAPQNDVYLRGIHER